jgi:hypothetical protein
MMASVVIHNITVIKQYIQTYCLVLNVMFKHPTVEAQYESVSKGLWAEVLGCVSLMTKVRDVVDIGPCSRF